eukprot:COSAG02_NODE_35435_length_468_cov_1.111111_1_plen_73_part_01
MAIRHHCGSVFSVVSHLVVGRVAMAWAALQSSQKNLSPPAASSQGNLVLLAELRSRVSSQVLSCFGKRHQASF